MAGNSFNGKGLHSTVNRPLGIQPTKQNRNRFSWQHGVVTALIALAIAPTVIFYGAQTITDRHTVDTMATASIAPVTGVPTSQQQQKEEASTQPPIDADIAQPPASQSQEQATAVPLPAPAPKRTALAPMAKRINVQSNVRRQQQTLAHLPDPDLSERGATGIIPKRSTDGLRAMDVYSRAPYTTGNFGVARVVIVIGGLGISQTSTKAAIDQLPGEITLAFAPYGNSLSRWMQQARKGGHELLLQLPMEPLDYPDNNPGPHTLRASADLAENIANLHWSMSRITNYVGVTNYLGNQLLSQPAGLSPIFAELSKRGLLFLDDGTVKNSMSEGVALKELLPFTKAHMVLDDTRSRQAISENLRKLAEQAKRTGLAIGVGNAFPDTVDLVSQFAKQAKQNGIELTPVSAVVRDPAR